MDAGTTHPHAQASTPAASADVDPAPSAPGHEPSRTLVGEGNERTGTKAKPDEAPDASVPSDDGTRPAQEMCRVRMPLGANGRNTVGSIYRSWVAYGHSYVATDADGNIVITGTFVGTIDFGTGPLSDNDADWALFVAKLDASCRLLWSHTYGAPGASVEGGPIGIGANGEIALGGSLGMTVDFGTGELSSTSGRVSALALALDADGTTRFAKVFPSDDTSLVYSVGVDGSGDVVVSGFGWDDPAFGGAARPYEGATLAKYTASGDPIWIRKLPPPTEGVHLDVAADGTLRIGGEANQPLDWGDGTTPLAPANSSLWLGELAPDGTHRWSTTYAQDVKTWGAFHAFDPSGLAIAVYGLASDPETYAAQRAIDTFDTTGALSSHATWISNQGAQGYDPAGFDLATDAQGNAIELGITKSALTFGDMTFAPLGDDDVYIAKHDRDGHLLWGAQEATDRADEALGVTTDADGDAIALWYSYDTSYQASDELVLVKFAP